MLLLLDNWLQKKGNVGMPECLLKGYNKAKREQVSKED